MTRIAWTRYNGDDVEAFAAMCLYRDRPGAVRIRPSRGDGGIDVYVRNSDATFDIYQVKKYAENLTSGQKSDTEKSYNTLKEFAAQREWDINTWHLVLPLDPTPENDEWLARLNINDPFDTKWEGLPKFDNWAADYPQVIDYYFADGNRRLDKELMRFLATTSIALPGVDADAAREIFETVDAAQVLEQVSLLNEAINAADPFYSYIISSGPRQTEPPKPTGDYPALVATSVREVGDQVITVHILAKFAEATEERPLKVKTTVTVVRGSPEEREWRQFMDYGRTPKNPVPVRDLTFDLPGGLASSHTEAELLIRPVEGSTEPFDRVLSVVSPGGDTIATVMVRFTDVQFSPDRTGGTSTGLDATGLLTAEILTKIEGEHLRVSYNFSLADDTGRNPQHMLDALTFVNAFYAPNLFRIGNPHVPRIRSENPISASGPADDSDTRRAALYLEYLRALVTIQQHADVEILIPDGDATTSQELFETIRTARLLRGESLRGQWEQITIPIHGEPPAIDPDCYQQMSMRTPLQATIGEHTVHLGMVRYEFAGAAIIGHSTDSNGAHTVAVAADPDNKQVVATWEGESTLPPTDHVHR